jgi:tetratricopeptide (TPR) repeat protein
MTSGADEATRTAIELLRQERHAEAVPLLTSLTRRQPGERAHWMNLGTALRATKRYDEALLAYAKAAALGESSADFSYNVGLLHVDRGDYESARSVLERAAALAPKDAEIQYQYAHCCYESLHADEALAALERWPDFDGLTSELTAKIALLLMNLGEPARAEVAIARAASDRTLDPASMLRLAQAHERNNRVEAARAMLERLESTPGSQALGDDLVLVRAQLAQREGRHADAEALFQRLLATCEEFHRRHFQLYPLAKSQDALGRHDDAFATLVEAHRSQIASLQRTAPEAMSRRMPVMNITTFVCDASDVAAWDTTGAPDTAESPVFIVAFPRSGTTLLELTLDAHPALATMDEQPYLQRALERLLAAGLDYPRQLANATQEQLDEARRTYWELTRRKVRLAPGQRLLDKNPLNLLRLPAIQRLFPNARILLAIRHPCDVLLSCFMQHFRAPEFALLCRDLATLALGYRRAFDFWYQHVALLQPTLREIRYETFVGEFDRSVRELTDFLELPWHDAMLEPAAHARAKGFISTPSYAQVVQPVNRRSIGRWRAYERHFEAALPLLRPYLERWSYDG